ncbi:MAG: MFS transporter [Chloroflexi bacterium]|nr:MFS transporter [Chloroflexota bacterium]
MTQSIERIEQAKRRSLEPQPLDALARQPFYVWLVVGTVCIGAFMGQLDASIAQLVLPTLEVQFHESLGNLEWVALAYLLTLAALLAPVGRLADLVGRKLLYTFGFLVFITGSALCGFSPNLLVLIASRVLQAVGAALLQANSVAIITAAAGPKRRGKAIGIQGTAQAVGLSVGPAVGGMLISLLGWRWVFFINVPAGLIGTVLGWLVLPPTESAGQQRQPFDFAGSVLLASALIGIMLVLSEGHSWGWGSPKTLLVVLAAIVLVVAFLQLERRLDSPVVDLRLFASRAFSLGNVTGLLSYAVTFGTFLLIPFQLERVNHMQPFSAGLILTAVPAALAVVAPVSGAWSDKVGPRPLTVLGMGITTVAFLLLALLAGDSHVILLLPALALLGVGLGLFTPSNNSAIMGSAPRNRLGVASGVLNMMRSLGTSIGVAISGTVLSVALIAFAGTSVTTLSAPPGVFRAALRVTFLLLAAFSLIAMLISTLRQTDGTGVEIDPALLLE